MEVLDGEIRIHHDRRHIVLTNEPPYLEQLVLLERQDCSARHDRTPIDGNVNPSAPFQRATYFGALLPHPEDVRAAVSGVLAIARNVSIPFGAPYAGFGLHNTECRTAIDLTSLRYCFELTTSPNVFWVDFADVDVSAGAPTLGVDPDDITLCGSVARRLAPVPAPYWSQPSERVSAGGVSPCVPAPLAHDACQRAWIAPSSLNTSELKVKASCASAAIRCRSASLNGAASMAAR